MTTALASPGTESGQCHGKERFETDALARQVAQRMSSRGKTVSAYSCAHCSGWHVGRPAERAQPLHHLRANDNVRRNKFNAKLTELDGRTFHSAKEAKRYAELKLLARSGVISGLILQPKFDLVVNDVRVCRYVADFEYRNQAGERIVEDCKGYLTEVYKLKRALMLAVHDIKILES